jgi:hypothetical protein
LKKPIIVLHLHSANRQDSAMNCMRSLFLFLMLLALNGCATLPQGPSVLALPAPGKPFDVFQGEDAICRQWALQQVGKAPQEMANQNTATNAILGTVIGAGLGAAIGAATGDPGIGAAIGAGSGLLGGTLLGGDTGQASGQEAQRRYDIAYQQCMYAKGNQIPGMAQGYQPSYPTPPHPSSSMDYPSAPAPYASPPSFPVQ